MPRRRKPVVALDVDGTLAQYHAHFIRFASEWTGKEIPLGYNGKVPFPQWCGMSKARYRQCKLAYRQGGMKRSMPTYPYARELTVGLRRAGAEVVICTTRPYLHLSNIEPDTLHWLRRNGIQYDDIIIGEHKYRQLAREYGKENIVMCLEDQEDQLLVGATIGLPMIAAVRSHNEFLLEPPNDIFHPVFDLDSARALGVRKVQEWKAAARKVK